MADFVIDRTLMEELQSDWLRLSQEMRGVTNIEEALIKVEEIREFVRPLIGDLLFDRDLWLNTETRSEAVNTRMARIRFDLDTFLTEIQDTLNSMEEGILKQIQILTPGTKEYKEDGGKTLASLKEREVDEETYAWNRAKGPFLQGFSKISTILVDDFFPYLEENMEVFEDFYSDTYDEELSVDDVLVTFTGNKPCSRARVGKYMKIIREVDRKVKEKGLDKIWTGRVYVHCGRRDKTKQFGVQYFSPPKDVIYIYDKPGPFLEDALLYSFGNKFYYGYLPLEKRRAFQSVMARPKRQNMWGLSQKLEIPDFARMFVQYVQGKMDPETKARFEPFLKEDFFQKLVREQSSNTEDSSELGGRALKLASLYLRSNRRG